MICFDVNFWESFEELQDEANGPSLDEMYAEVQDVVADHHFQCAQFARYIVEVFFEACNKGEISLARAIFYAVQASESVPQDYNLDSVILRELKKLNPEAKKSSKPSRKSHTFPRRIRKLVVSAVAMVRANDGFPVTREARGKGCSAFDVASDLFRDFGLEITPIQCEKWYNAATKPSTAEFESLQAHIVRVLAEQPEEIGGLNSEILEHTLNLQISV